MRSRAFRFVGLALCCAAAGTLTFSGSRGQAPRPLPPAITNPPAPAPVIKQVSAAQSASPDSMVAVLPQAKGAPIDRFRDLESLPGLTRQVVMSTRRGIEWLARVNQPNGRFIAGFHPALWQVMDDDSFLKQATATFALARAARFTRDEAHAVRASQAILSLLAETRVDPTTPGLRMPSAPSVISNRLAGAAWTALAIYELPEADAALTAQAEELCQFILSRQRPDGSIQYTDSADDASTKSDLDGVNLYPGPALFALASSQRRIPTETKARALRSGISFYRGWFREHPHPALVPWLTAACVEVFGQTRDPGCAAFVFEMNDWLCKLQYGQLDPRHRDWRGGFQSFTAGKPAGGAPTIDTALYTQSLSDACRMIRGMPTPDTDRYDHYRTALAWSLQFLASLQYGEGNTQHFMPAGRAALVGGFHPSQQDGDLRVEHTAQALSAMIQFLNSGAEKE